MSCLHSTSSFPFSKWGVGARRTGTLNEHNQTKLFAALIFRHVHVRYILGCMLCCCATRWCFIFNHPDAFSLLDFYDEFVSGIFPRLFRLIHFVDTNDEFAKQENEQRALRIYQIDKHYWLRWFCSPHEYTSKTSDTRMQYESDTFATIHVFAASKSGKMLELYSARVASTMTTMSEANKFACWFFIGSRVRFVSLAETSLLPVRAISFISLSAEENIKREIIHAVARWPHKHWPSSIAIFCTIVVRCPPSALDTLSSAPDLVIFLILFWRLTMSSRWFIINPLREELGHD